MIKLVEEGRDTFFQQKYKENICKDNSSCALKRDRLGHSQREVRWGYFPRRTNTVKWRCKENCELFGGSLSCMREIKETAMDYNVLR